MKFYIASKFENKERVKLVRDKMLYRGHKITKDWTTSEFPSPEEAREDFLGAFESDIFIGIFEDNLRYQGALVELGIALTAGARIYILGNQLKNMIFMYLPKIKQFDSLDLLLEQVDKDVAFEMR